MAEYYYRVNVKEDNMTPDIGVTYKVYMPARPEMDMVVETKEELDPGDYIEIIAADNPIITSAVNWWAQVPADEPDWQDAPE